MLCGLLMRAARGLRIAADWCEGAALFGETVDELEREEMRVSEELAAPSGPIDVRPPPASASASTCRVDVELCIVCHGAPCAGCTLVCRTCLETVHA